MKGSLHTDLLMSAVLQKETGLRTSRRISHVFILEPPLYNRTLFITDAAINIYPSLEDKVDIVQNAIDLVHVLGVKEPRAAILSAVETVCPKITSTLGGVNPVECVGSVAKVQRGLTPNCGAKIEIAG